MQHFRSIEEIHVGESWLTIGSFDGVHRGHHAILQRLTAEAHANGVPAIVLTFYPHPSVVLGKRRNAKYLTTPKEQAALLSEIGVDILITHPFTPAVAEFPARAFLTYLRAHVGFQQLWVGYDFAMGHDREGDVPTLRRLGKEMGYRLHIIPAVKVAGELVSSSHIRTLLIDGKVDKAAELLGRPYSLDGRVVRGQGRGKSLGIPTANLEIWDQRLVPGSGVYICMATTEKGEWGAVTNIGVRPTFGNQESAPTVETHLLGFHGDLYDQTLALAFLARVRGEVRFPTPDALVAQIQADIAQARQLLREWQVKSETIP